MVALLTVDAKASAQWLAGLELSRKLNRQRALPISLYRSTVRFCVKFRLRKRATSAASAASIQSRMASHPAPAWRTGYQTWFCKDLNRKIPESPRNTCVSSYYLHSKQIAQTPSLLICGKAAEDNFRARTALSNNGATRVQ